jgi:predicted transcriptional regulator
MKRVYLVTGVLVVLLLSLAAPAAASFGEYSVGPAYGSTGTPASDLAPISFWDLSLREMALVAVLALCPVCVIPIEIFFACKLYALLGFRRIVTRNVLENATRSEIYRVVIATPGISFPVLQQQLSLSRGSLTYHLTLLCVQRKISALKANGSTSYFENNGRYDGLEQKVLNYLGHDTEKRIISLLLAAPGSTRTDLERALAVSGPTVTWHVKRLIYDGILRVRKDGRYSRYSLTGEAADCFGHYLGRVPAPTASCDAQSRTSVVPAAVP